MKKQKSFRAQLRADLEDQLRLYGSYRGLPLASRLRVVVGLAVLFAAPLLYTWTTFDGRVEPFILFYLMIGATGVSAGILGLSIVVIVFERTHYGWMVLVGLLLSVPAAVAGSQIGRRIVETEGTAVPEGDGFLLAAWLAGYTLVFTGVNMTLRSTRTLYEEKARRAADLALAQDIQSRFLASVSIAQKEFAVHAETRTAEEVGGDFFEVHRQDGQLIMAVGDVSGHGAGAGLLMSMIKGAFSSEVRHSGDLESLVQRLNSLVVTNADRRHFATFCAVSVDISSGQAQVVNAGHLPLLYVPAAEEPSGCINPAGPGLGLMKHPPLTTSTVSLKPGDTLLIVSDGLVEAFDATGEEFGMEGVRALLEAHRRAPVAQLCAALFEAVYAFGGPRRLKDDATVLAFRRSGAASPRVPTAEMEGNSSVQATC